MKTIAIKLESTGLSSPCWIWTGARGNGYGVISQYKNKINAQAHRIVYEALMGYTLGNKDLHHTCPNKLCVNPTHLEPLEPGYHVQIRGNIREGKCLLHPLSTVKIYNYSDGRTRYTCTDCHRDFKRKSNRKRLYTLNPKS